MKVTTATANNCVYVYLNGELDQSVSSSLKEELDEFLSDIEQKNVIFNMKNLTFMDSTGIGLIMGRYKNLRKKNISLYITEPNTQIDKVIKISGIYNIIPKI